MAKTRIAITIEESMLKELAETVSKEALLTIDHENRSALIELAISFFNANYKKYAVDSFAKMKSAKTYEEAKRIYTDMTDFK